MYSHYTLMASYFGVGTLEDRAKNKSVITTINLSRSPSFRLYGNGYRKDVPETFVFFFYVLFYSYNQQSMYMSRK